MFNHGNTCFLNSTLQCLVHTPPLAQALIHDPLAISGFIKQQDNRPQNPPILFILKRLMEEVWSNNSPKVVSPRLMVNTLRRLSKQFHAYQQEDAHEYLLHLLDTVNNEILKRYNLPIFGQHSTPSDPKVVSKYDTTLISRIFHGKLCNIMSCNRCKYQSKTFNNFQDISLNIGSGIQTVESAIDLFIKPEKLGSGNEWMCDGCKKKVQVRSNFLSNSLTSLHSSSLRPPNNLLFHLLLWSLYCISSAFPSISTTRSRNTFPFHSN